MPRNSAVFLLTVCAAASAAGQTPDALIQKNCGGCHNAANTVGAPVPETLRQMTWQSIVAALEKGKMKGIGDTLTPAQRELIAKSLGTNAAPAVSEAARCSAALSEVSGGDWNGWSDPASTRFQRPVPLVSRAGTCPN